MSKVHLDSFDVGAIALALEPLARQLRPSSLVVWYGGERVLGVRDHSASLMRQFGSVRLEETAFLTKLTLVQGYLAHKKVHLP